MSVATIPDGPSGSRSEACLATTQAQQLDLPLAPERKRRNRDALPEYTRYRDDGCEVSPKCVDCPLPRCRYEEPGGLRAILNEARDDRIVEARLHGASVGELSLRFGVSKRTVFRVLEARGVRGPRRRAVQVNIRIFPAPRPGAREEVRCA